jgi:hypothetical protein
VECPESNNRLGVKKQNVSKLIYCEIWYLHYTTSPHSRNANYGNCHTAEPSVIKKGHRQAFQPVLHNALCLLRSLLRLTDQKFRGGETSDSYLVQGLECMEDTKKFPLPHFLFVHCTFTTHFNNLPVYFCRQNIFFLIFCVQELYHRMYFTGSGIFDCRFHL